MQGAERVYIIDPLGNLMMYYPPGAEPGGMLKDLQKLLKYSQIG
jgi:cytochrome oxidase Cu insertion factor (SCO1/SenC/PrrC family)